jgi:transcription initiation factor TFIIB
MDNNQDIWSLFDTLSLKEEEDNSKNKECNTIVEECLFCKSKNVIIEDCNYVCQDCCSVLARYIDMNAEWRFYGGDDNKSCDPARCGMPTSDLLPESSLGSVIGYSNNSSYEMMMLRKYHRWSSMTYKERSLYNIFDGLTIYATNSGIPKTIIEQAKNYYKQLSEMQITRGENRAGLIASSVYMSCKHHGVPRSTKEIAKIFNLKSTTMTKGCKKFMEMMKIQIECSTPIDFIQRFCSKMNLDQDIRELAKNVILKADKLNLICESTPPSIAAASIYLVGVVKKLNFSKKELSISCEISQVTIGKCYKKLYAYRHYLFDEQVD